MLLITTSHRPTKRIRALGHDLKRMMPSAIQMNRGKLSFEEVVKQARIAGADRVMFLQRWKGGPGKIELYELNSGVDLFFPVIYLASTQHQNELQGRIHETKRLVIVKPQVDGQELKHLSESLSTFLDTPLVEREQAVKDFEIGMTFGKTNSHLAMSFEILSNNTEIGPRLVIKNLIWSDKMSL
jgi:U3 small nucleolar ribonucleoprotein protein IMP4